MSAEDEDADADDDNVSRAVLNETRRDHCLGKRRVSAEAQTKQPQRRVSVVVVGVVVAVGAVVSLVHVRATESLLVRAEKPDFGQLNGLRVLTVVDVEVEWILREREREKGARLGNGSSDAVVCCARMSALARRWLWLALVEFGQRPVDWSHR